MKKEKNIKCRRCGCTKARACPGGCSWVVPDVPICSACLTPTERQLYGAHLELRGLCRRLFDTTMQLDNLAKNLDRGLTASLSAQTANRKGKTKK